MTEEQRLKHNAYMREWNKRNRHRLTAAIQQRRASDPEYRDRMRELYRATHERHRDERNSRRNEASRKVRAELRRHRPPKQKKLSYYARHRDEVLAKVKQWVANNHGRYRVNQRLAQHRRRVRLGNGVGEYTEAQWLAKLEYYGYRCRYCHCSLTYKTATQDHVIPIAKRAIGWISNIVPACLSCNRKKGKQDFRKYIQQ